MKPLAHGALREAITPNPNTPNLPFRNVSRQLKEPALASDPTTVIAPVFRFTVALSRRKLLSAAGEMSGPGGGGGVMLAVEAAAVAPTANDCCACGAGLNAPLPA